MANSECRRKALVMVVILSLVGTTCWVVERPAAAQQSTAHDGVTLNDPFSHSVAVAASFAAKHDFPTGTNPRSVAVGDLNGDGKLDLAVANSNSNTVSVLLNTTASGVATPSFAAKQDFATGAVPWSVQVGDLNGDGKLDLVVANSSDSTVSVLLNTTAPGAATPSFAAKQDFATGAGPVSVTVADVNGDGKLDLVIANNSSSVSVLLNTTALGAATPSFAAKQDFATGSTPESVAVGDLNGDGKLDLATANFNANTVSVLLNTTATGATIPSFAAKQDFATGAFPVCVNVGDLNGDDKLDLAVANLGADTVSVLLNTTAPGAATPSFAAKQDFSTGTTPYSVTVGDLNDDGSLDLATANEGDNTVSVLINTTAAGAATPSFAVKQDFVTGAQPLSVTVGDLNGDGKLDLAVANYSSTVSVLLNTVTPTAANGSVSGTINDDTGKAVSGVTIALSGTESRETITDVSGSYHFDNVETNGFYTVTPARVDYSFNPANRNFSLLGAHTDASFTATANGDHLNAIDTTEFFVRQQYLDFLNREPDPPGFIGWVNTIRNCDVGDTSCDRVHVSEAFFRSQEFQERGYFVYRFYSSALGRKPDYAEFTPDLARVSGFLTNDQLEAAKVAFINNFMARTAFVAQYNDLSNAAYVDALLQIAGVSLSNRQALIDSLNNKTQSRAQVLRQVVESAEVYQKYYNQAFVVMEYFGYLRRDPDALYTNWIQVLDANPADSRHMVDGFVNSTEYRSRFAP
jgi:hypothetical protein